MKYLPLSSSCNSVAFNMSESKSLGSQVPEPVPPNSKHLSSDRRIS